jgi:putative transport protein
MPPSRRVRVTSRDVDGRTLRDLDLARRHGCLVTGVQRGGVVVEPMPELELHRFDVLLVIGPHEAVRACAQELGRFERPTQETDIAIYAGGIFLGLLLAKLPLPLPGVEIRLGLAGGLLLAGVVLGRLRRIGPFSAHVPRAARQLVRDLGILLFVAETGVTAGGSPLGGMREILAPTLFSAVLATVLPVVAAALVGRWMRLRAVEVWGSIGGGMTSSAALIALRRAADSNEPALAYAASYAFASVLVTLAGQAVVALIP